MSLKLSIQHVSVPSLEQFALAFRGMDNRRILSIYRRQLRVHQSGIRREVRAAIFAIPSKKSGSPEPLRVRLARCVKVFSDVTGAEATVGVYMAVDQMPPGERSLPLYEEGVSKRGQWRHPVFGDRDIWASQAAHPYFFPVVAAHRGSEMASIDRATEEVRKRLFA